MKRFVFLLILPSLIFGSSIGILAGTEIGGRERLYIGGKVEVGDVLRIGLDSYHVISSFESIPEEVSNARYVELDPMLIISLGGESTRFYVGVGPMFILDLSSFEFNLYSAEILRGKAGVSLKLGGLSIFAEALTSFSYDPFGTSGVYAAQGGMALGF